MILSEFFNSLIFRNKDANFIDFIGLFGVEMNNVMRRFFVKIKSYINLYGFVSVLYFLYDNDIGYLKIF